MRTVVIEFVQGLVYTQAVPLGASRGAGSKVRRPSTKRTGKPPPWWLVRASWLISPILRARHRLARRYIEDQGWRQDVRWWDTVAKPALHTRLEALSARTPAELSDDELIEHLEECLSVLEENLRAHFRMNPAVGIPVGRFLVHARRWTELEDIALLNLTSQWNPVFRHPDLVRLVDALRARRQVDWVQSNMAPASEFLAELQDRPDGVGEAATTWVRAMEVRQIVTGNMSMPTGAEVPELLRERLRQALAQIDDAPEPVSTPDLHVHVPASQRDRFDALLAEARHVYRVRDERSAVMDSWAFGVCRRGALEAGHRLVKRGLLNEADHAIELEQAELAELLREGRGAKPNEVEERVRFRIGYNTADAPRNLGGEPGERPPLDYFPPAVADMLEAMSAYDELMFSDAAPIVGDDLSIITGAAASNGRVRGIARLVDDPREFASIRPGDILVARTTMPAYDSALSVVGGVVTDYGGALSHAAIVAREYGIPAVVNTRDATSRISDGALIEVDGDLGLVRILGR